MLIKIDDVVVNTNKIVKSTLILMGNINIYYSKEFFD